MTENEADVSVTKITDYFPSSPKRSDGKAEECSELKIKLKEISESLDLKNVDKTTLLSSVLITPESSPCKENIKDSDSVSSEIIEKKNVSQKSLCKDVFSEGHEQTEHVPQKKSRQRKKQNKSKAEAQKNGSKIEESKPKTTKKKKQTQAELHNSLVTDYFPVRRSGRVCKSELKKTEQEDVRQRILEKREDGLKVVDFERKGRGVVAVKPFRRGDFVIEYAGDLIDLGKAKEREVEYSEDTDKYGCYMYYFNFKNKNYCVDATAESGRLGRLINHSRCGNCQTKVIEINGRPYLTLSASRDVQVGEELLYDYGDRSKSSIESHPWLTL